MSLRKLASGALVAPLVLALGLTLYIRFKNVFGCSERDQIAQTLIEKRAQVLSLSATSPALCKSYRELIFVLENAKKFTSICGRLGVIVNRGGQGLGDDFAQLSTEAAFYVRLVDKKCTE